MTRTKRIRIFAESGVPRPGDLVELKRGHAFRTLPQAKGRILRYSVDGEIAIILGFDHFLEDALLMSCNPVFTIGWYDVTEYQECP